MRLFSIKEEAEIVAAIRLAEQETTGEIRVYVEDFCLEDDPVLRAYEVFEHYQMEKTQYRNGVLIYLAEKSRQFAIFGDEAIHKASGGAIFWHKEKNIMRHDLRLGHYKKAVIHVIEDVGCALKKYFPAPKGWENPNELPDEIIYG